jgi:hypothetical protein
LTCFTQNVQFKKPSQQVLVDQEKAKLTGEVSNIRRKYDEALKTIRRQEKELATLDIIRNGVESYTITAKEGDSTSEATPVVLASDWHSEEVVTSAQTNGMNEFNVDIYKARARMFFQSTLRLIRLLNQDVKISQVILALLGDFTTNHLHEEAAETNRLSPIHAIIDVQNDLIAGLDFLLHNSSYSFILPCKVGNHSRTTKKVRFATENGHSLEHIMYVSLAAHYRNEPRLTFLIDDGYHIYMDVYDQTLRLHHGHAINYQGGVGGIYIPALKAIAAWDQGRQADIDAFGHFHQRKDDGKFQSNGSLIGYNSYAVSIKAKFEPPCQTLFLIDKRRGKTCTWPILVE